VRRTVATLLVVATALLMAVPVGASEASPAGPTVLPAAPAVVQAPAAPAAPAVVQAPPSPAVVQAPPSPAPPAVAAPAVPAPAPAAARPAVRSPRAKALDRVGLSDEAYAARLQAELCRARQIFCGLDQGGRYPAR
jgi:hypothetical protein